MAVRNGARFLPEQLDSLSDQAGPPLSLLWRDDGSEDASAEVIGAWARQTGAAARRLDQPEGRLGAARGFLALLAAAPDDAPFFAFCDQDDVWLPAKTARAVAALDAVPPGIPALACARQRLVDAALRPLGESSLPGRPPGFGNAIVQNIATGCTIVLNPAARALLLAAPPPPPGSMHDWWAYILVTGAGGRVLFDPEPALLYRQHGGNTIGADPPLLDRLSRALRRGPRGFTAMVGAHLDCLAAVEPLLAEEARRVLVLLRGMRGRGPLGRLRLARQAGLYRQSRVQDLAMAAWFALAPLPPARGTAP
ncbi:glycosyltransferase [Dankookia sp. GCM10030260]|uniref:glycosyltransferase n=1 Tax=Dankookia sp. GCM10030260 TaxID=3273390 RepID=UPI00360B02B1